MTELITNISFPIPKLIDEGLNEASKKFGVSKSDIVRSICYDFLISSGVITDSKKFNSQEDVLVGME